jgi:uncharacterized protein with beta-barrel porin domain
VDAQAAAAALEGDAGDDTLVQRAGQLTITATAHAGADSVDWTFFGNTGTEAALSAQSRAVGMDGGAGVDQLSNETAFTASAASTLDATGGGNVIFGNADAATDIGASAVAIGLLSGDGDDRIESVAAITLDATATVNSDRVAFSFAGNPDINELLKASSTVVGLDGGSGDDVIVNTAVISATSTALATTNGLAKATLGGGSSASGKAVADAQATGISGDGGADTIDNGGALTIAAIIGPRTNNSASAGTFFGDGHVEGRGFGTLAATGIDAGDGDNLITNRAALAVTTATTADAVSNTFASGSGFSFGVNGTANTYTATEIDATAAGIRAGNGANQVLNTGAISVHLEDTVARAYTDPNGGATSGSGNGDIDVIVSGTGRGIEVGDGNALVVSQGTVDVNASPVARGASDADGTASDSANSTINAYAFGEAKGIAAGEGDHQIRSSGAIRVTAAPVAMGYADVDGGRTLGGATGRSNDYSTGKAYGIEVGNGTTRIENDALLSVTAAPEARPIDDRNVRAEGYGSGDANAYTFAQSISEAAGIHTGIGTYTIVNAGTIEVSANSHASGGYYVSPGGLSSGHADSSTVLYAEGRATGIWTGGALDIRNSGSILVTALPIVNFTYESGDGGPYRYRETWGTATGIDASHADGAQSVINDGVIVARAGASSFAENDGGQFDPTSLRMGGAPVAVGVDLRGHGYKTVVNNGTIEATADLSTLYPGPDFSQAVFANAVSVGGDGAKVVNNGTITAQRTLFGLIGFRGYAVYLSSIGDQGVVLSLGRQSVTNGDVALYGGRATLELDGTPVLNGTFELDAGRDFDLVLHNDGSFDHALPTVANLTKTGAGVFNLPALNSVRTLVLDEGVVSLASGYTFAPTGQMRVNIHGDGTWSGLQAAGMVRLDGTLSVMRDDELYADGTRYAVVQANGIAADSAFDDVKLPEPTALASFSTERTTDAFEVVAHVRSFASLAGLGNERVMARSLDALARHPSDAMRAQLARIQGLSGDELHQTFNSLSPVIHAFGTTAAFSNYNQYDDAIWQRLFDPALNASSAPVSAARGGRELADPGRTLESQPGVWIRGFDVSGSRDSGVTTTAYDYQQSGYALGYEQRVGVAVVGVSVGRVENLVKAEGLTGRDHVNSDLYSMYGSYSHSGRYLDGIVSYGTNAFDHERWIVVGDSMFAAEGTHDGHVFSAGLNGGQLFDVGRWVLGPYASLQYTSQREQGFTESGGDLAAVMPDRSTRSLVSTLGGRIGRRIAQGNGEWLPELAITWRHDHALDDGDVTASYVGSPGIGFTVDGEENERDSAQVGLGVSYRSAGFAARLTYRTEFRGELRVSGLFGGLQYVW